MIQEIRKRYKSRIDEFHEYLWYLGVFDGLFDEIRKPDDNTIDEIRTPENNSIDEIRRPNDNRVDEMRLTPKQIERTIQVFGNMPTKEEVKKKCEEDILEYLIFAYGDGVKSVSEMFDTFFGVDEEKLYNALVEPTAGETYIERINKHFDEGNLRMIYTLADTEFHRMFNQGIYDHSEGARTKRWCTMLDERVRDTHDYLEGKTIPYEEEFYTFDNDHAFRPGGFQKVENNANCRCFLFLQK